MPKSSQAEAVKKAPSVNLRLVKELQKYLANTPTEVLGHIEAPAYCCGNGTVALVKIDRGDPAPRK
jgi:hypothetical protein